MGRPRKISLNELKQAHGNVETEKSVKEVVASVQERVAPELKAEVIKGDEVKKEAPSNKEPSYVVHGALAPEQTNSIQNILRKYRKDIYVGFSEPKEYSKAIRNMSLNELHAHAIDVSVIPTSDKEKLIKNLENAFGVYINKQVPKTFPPSNMTVQNAKNIEDIIANKIGRK